MKYMIVFLTAIVLAGCGPEATMPMEKETPIVRQPVMQANTRFTVSRVGVFSDDLAYGDKRGIYVITDSKTGQEFVGISGVGISALGSHQSGKIAVKDER